VFGGRPVALMGATPGGMGTAHAQTAWLPVLRVLDVCFVNPVPVGFSHINL